MCIEFYVPRFCYYLAGARNTGGQYPHTNPLDACATPLKTLSSIRPHRLTDKRTLIITNCLLDDQNNPFSGSERQAYSGYQFRGLSSLIDGADSENRPFQTHESTQQGSELLMTGFIGCFHCYQYSCELTQHVLICASRYLGKKRKRDRELKYLAAIYPFYHKG